MSARPRLAVMADRAVAAGAVTLVRALGRWADVAPLAATDDPDALFATSPGALTRAAPCATPTAVWIGPGHTSGAVGPHVLVVSDLPSVSDEAAQHHAIWVPRPTFDVAAHAPVAPLVRSRWRGRLDLPARLVVLVGSWAAPTTDDDDIWALDDDDPDLPTALAVASVVVATGETAGLAALVGAPLVTDAATATRLGASIGDVLLGEPSTALDVARALSDPSAIDRAARSSRRASALAHRLDVGPAALAVARHLGLAPPVTPTPLATLDLRLDELGTPPNGVMRRRAHDGVNSLFRSPTLQEAR